MRPQEACSEGLSTYIEIWDSTAVYKKYENKILHKFKNKQITLILSNFLVRTADPTIFLKRFKIYFLHMKAWKTLLKSCS